MQQSARAPNELATAEPRLSMGPTPTTTAASANPQTSAAPRQQFTSNNDPTSDGPPARFQPPGANLGPRLPSQQMTGGPQFPAPRPPYAQQQQQLPPQQRPPGPPVRAPGPGAGRPPPPGPPGTAPPPPPTLQGGPRPPQQQQQQQQQGPPIRGPFPGGANFPNPRGPPPQQQQPPPSRGPMQRNDSLGGPDPRQIVNRPGIQQQPQQQQPMSERAKVSHQMSAAERITTEAEINQQRPPSGTPSMKSEDSIKLDRPKSAVVAEGDKVIGDARQQPPKPPAAQQQQQQQQQQQKQETKTMPNNVNGDARREAKPPPQQVDPVNKDQENKTQASRESESIKGFDNGRRRSISSAKSLGLELETNEEPPGANNAKSATKKKTTFADENRAAAPKTAPGVNSAAAAVGNGNKTSERVATPGPGPGPKEKQTTMKKSPSSRSINRPDAENDSGVDESTQHKETPKSNGVMETPRKSDKRSVAGSPLKSPSKTIKSLPKTPDAAPSMAQEKKKVPMNKIQVGAAPSPNLKAVRSKIGSLQNSTHKPGGGNVKIENRKLDFSKAQPKIAAKNDKYAPSGGDKKITQVKLQWNAKPKIGSLDNATYKPGGGDKKIESVKLDFKEKAKPKVGSKENAKHIPGGGSVKSASPPKTPQDNTNKIESQKIEIKAESKVGSMDNMKHKPGGGDKKIFDDKSYLRQTSSNVGSMSGSASQETIKRPISLSGLAATVKKQDSLDSPSLQTPQPPPSTPTRARRAAFSPTSPVTAQAVRTSLVGSPTKKSPATSPVNLQTATKGQLRLPEFAASPDEPTMKQQRSSRLALPRL